MDSGDSLNVKISGGSRSIYVVSFVPTKSGKHVLEVTFDGVPVLGSPAMFFVPGGEKKKGEGEGGPEEGKE